MKKLIFLLLVTVLALGSAWAANPVKQAVSDAVIDGAALTDRIVVRFAPEALSNSESSHRIAELLSGLRVAQMRPVTTPAGPEKNDLLSDVYYLTLENNNPAAVIAQLRANENIIYAEPLYLHFTSAVPNDPYFVQQGFFTVMQAQQAWDIFKGEQGDAVIAVVDGGTDADHPDLAANLWINTGETPNNGIDDDNNGYIDDYNGWNFPTDSPDPSGLSSTPLNANHGTHTGGSIAAVTDNNTGVAGASWNAKLMAINAGSAAVDNSIAYGYDGVLYAIDNGADVVSCSWGRAGGVSVFEQEVMNYAAANGVAVVAAAGNDNSPDPHYPSSYNHVLSVAATSNSDVKASFSNYGTTVDVSAPGVNIYSTYNNGSYGPSSGTSMACPLAAGFVGLVKAQHADWSGIQAAEQIRQTADNIDTQNPSYAGLLGKGRVNAYRALTESTPSIRYSSSTFTDGNGDGIIDPGETINLSITLINYLAQATNIGLTLSSDDPYVNITQASRTLFALNTMQQASPSQPFTFEVSTLAQPGHVIDFTLDITSGSYSDSDHFQLIVLPTFGNVDINNIAVSLTNLGRIGFADADNQTGGSGFSYAAGGNLLFEGALIVGTGQTNLSNGARGELVNQVLLFDNDFKGVTGGDLQVSTPGTITDQESYAAFNDALSDTPLDIRITQESFASSAAGFDDFIILRYTVENLSGSAINNFHFGFFYDWDIDGANYITNMTGYDAIRRTGYAYDSGSGPDTRVGMTLLSPGTPHFRAIANDGADGNFGIYDGYTDAEKWQSISGGTSVSVAGPNDISCAFAAGPENIPADELAQFYFALVAGAGQDNFNSNVDSAIVFYDRFFVSGIADRNPELVPGLFRLQANYPNPFNPSTQIEFSLERSGPVQLAVFDTRGARIRNLVNNRLTAGNHSVVWDGRDDNGNAVSSGTYFYRLQSGDRVQTRKMLLVK
jgi:serine protease